MKVDMIVSAMIQQIDRNLRSQIAPAATYRVGEILRGRVMLADGESPQIRLDSGALLNAMPEMGVLLSNGATVTLRVTAQMDGQLVMQLLDQQLTDGRAAQTGGGAAIAEMDATPQGKAVLQAMERMRLPIREETAKQALEIMARFPGLDADKAVFLAANRIAATQASVDALNRLIDGRATTGGELMALADMLTAAVLETEQAQPAAPSAATPAAGSSQLAGSLPAAQDAGAQPGPAVTPQSGAEAMGLPSPGSGNPEPATVAQPGQPQQANAAQAGPQVAAQQGPSPAVAQGPAQALLQADGMLELQSLVFVALGAAEASMDSGAATALQRYGLLQQAVALALDGPFLSDQDVAARLNEFVSALPEESRRGVSDFMGKLIEGLGRYLDQGTLESFAKGGEGRAPERLAAVVKQIGEMFARVDRDAGGEALMRAAAGQRVKVAHIAAQVGNGGEAVPEAARQLTRIANHVGLIEDISRYAYRQIPVEMDGRHSTVELYVLNRGRAGKKPAVGSASILIALDTANLGHVETLISVSQRNLRLRFGMERPELVGLADPYLPELGQALQAIGYRVADVSTQVIARPVTPLNVAERVEPEPGNLNRLDMTV